MLAVWGQSLQNHCRATYFLHLSKLSRFCVLCCTQRNLNIIHKWFITHKKRICTCCFAALRVTGSVTSSCWSSDCIVLSQTHRVWFRIVQFIAHLSLFALLVITLYTWVAAQARTFFYWLVSHMPAVKLLFGIFRHFNCHEDHSLMTLKWGEKPGEPGVSPPPHFCQAKLNWSKAEGLSF